MIDVSYDRVVIKSLTYFGNENEFRENESGRRAFRTRFKIPYRQTVPNQKSIVLWVKHFK